MDGYQVPGKCIRGPPCMQLFQHVHVILEGGFRKPSKEICEIAVNSGSQRFGFRGRPCKKKHVLCVCVCVCVCFKVVFFGLLSLVCRDIYYIFVAQL